MANKHRYNPGAPRPVRYIEQYPWAKAQEAAGYSRVACAACRFLHFSFELDDHNLCPKCNKEAYTDGI